MGRIFVSEVKKLVKDRFIIASFVALMCLNLFIVGKGLSETVGIEGHDEIVNMLSGRMDAEKVTIAKDKVDEYQSKILSGTYSTEYRDDLYTGYEFNEYEEFAAVYGEMARRYRYASVSEMISQKAARLAAEEIYFPGVLRRLYYERISQAFSGRIIRSYTDTQSLEFYLASDTSSFFSMMFLMLLIGLSFRREKSGDMGTFLYTSRYSYLFIMRMKFVACLLLGAVYFLISEITVFVKARLYRLGIGLSDPIYSVKGFENTVLRVNILVFILIRLALCLLGLACVSGCYFLIAGGIKNTVHAFAVMMVFSVLIIAFGQIRISALNPVMSLNSTHIIQRENQDLSSRIACFGYELVIVVNAVYIAVLNFFIRIRYGKKR